tara:strand:+ start:419 stop:1300 length:882 start_codon:yes stop_codon:yes gene_type:complete
LTTNENNEEEITMHDQGISPEFAEVYVQTVQDGTDFAAKQRVAILSIARNSEDKLIQNLPFLDTLSEWFKECSFFFYENDSSDNTPRILQDWASNNPNATAKCEKLDTEYLPLSTSTTRTENLAKARNHCIEYVKQNIDNLDYVIVLDSDFIDFSVRGLLNSFGWMSKHPHISAMVGFNFLKKYIIFPNGTQTKNKILTNYDSWAYRHTWWGDIQQAGLMYWFQYWIPLVGSPIWQVNSAFGGCGIYKASEYIQGEYTGENCEHVMFHQSLYRNIPGFSLNVNPSMVMYVDLP